MAVAVTHTKVATLPDQPGVEVNAGEWNATHTVTGLGALAALDTIGTSQIDAAAVTYAKIQNVSANSRILGRITTGAGSIEELTAANAKTILAIASTDISGLGTLATQSGTFSGTSSGTNTGDQTSVTGNAGTATALQTGRNINGVSFDGTANITVAAAAVTLTGNTLAAGVTASSLTSLGTIASLAATSGTVANTPANATDITNKAYVDNAFAGFSPRSSCRLATAAALTATYVNGASGVGATLTNAGALAALVIDGVSVAAGDRILIKNQASTFQNGIYSATTIGSGVLAWVLTRASDYDQSAEIFEGTYTDVIEGTANTETQWQETTSGTITVGTTAIVFSELLVAAQTVTLTGDITGSGSGSIATTLANVVSAGTGTKITANAKGLVTTIANASLASADFVNQGTTTTVLHGNAAGNPSFGAVALGTDVSGTLAAAQFPALTGDVTTVAGALAATIGASRVTRAMLAADGKNWTFLGQGTASTAVRTGVVTWAGTFKQLHIEYFISGYSGSAIGRVLVGPTAGISETGTTFATQQLTSIATTTLGGALVSLPGWPTAQGAAAAVARWGWMRVQNVAASIKRMEGAGQYAGTAATTAPSGIVLWGNFNDTTNLINKAELAVYTDNTTTVVSGVTFNAGTYINVWGRNDD